MHTQVHSGMIGVLDFDMNNLITVFKDQIGITLFDACKLFVDKFHIFLDFNTQNMPSDISCNVFEEFFANNIFFHGGIIAKNGIKQQLKLASNSIAFKAKPY